MGFRSNDEALCLARTLWNFLKKTSLGLQPSGNSLLHSVREEHSGHYIKMLKPDIPVFRPRARAWFPYSGVSSHGSGIACGLGMVHDNRGQMSRTVQKLAQYIVWSNRGSSSNYGQLIPCKGTPMIGIRKLPTLRKGKASDLTSFGFTFYKSLLYELL